MQRNKLTFLGWGLVGEPQDGMIVETGSGPGIDVTGYSADDYWNGDALDSFAGPDTYGVVPIYAMPDGKTFPPAATQYPYLA